MPRWYAGFRCRGKSVSILETIGRVIDREGLADIVPLVRVERDAHKRYEFYLFLAIESSQVGEYPEELTTLLSLPMLSDPFSYPFKLDEIRSMSDQGFEVRDYALRIPFLAPPSFTDEDFLSDDPDEYIGATIKKGTLPDEQFDRLLAWISAKGSGSWDGFQGAVQSLGIQVNANEARRLLKRLRLLGHVETSADGKRWSVAPPVLIRQCYPSNSRRFFLAGQRDCELLERLGAISEIKTVEQAVVSAPTVLELRLTNPKNAIQYIKAIPNTPLRYGGVVAEWFAEYVPSISEWMSSLQKLPGLIPTMFDVRRHDGRNFVPVAFDGKTGMYELWPLSSKNAPRSTFTAFYHAESGSWFRGEWYGLLFLARLVAGQRCPAFYLADKGILALPTTHRIPELYERTLVLASGILPTVASPWLKYRAISPRVARSIATKLHLQIEGLPEDA